MSNLKMLAVTATILCFMYIIGTGTIELMKAIAELLGIS